MRFLGKKGWKRKAFLVPKHILPIFQLQTMTISQNGKHLHPAQVSMYTNTPAQARFRAASVGITGLWFRLVWTATTFQCLRWKEWGLWEVLVFILIKDDLMTVKTRLHWHINWRIHGTAMLEVPEGLPSFLCPGLEGVSRVRIKLRQNCSYIWVWTRKGPWTIFAAYLWCGERVRLQAKASIIFKTIAAEVSTSEIRY